MEANHTPPSSPVAAGVLSPHRGHGPQRSSRHPQALKFCGLVVMAAAVGALNGCGSLPTSGPPKTPVYTQETFGDADTFSRLVESSPAHACEAARRALLSQGYIVTVAQTDRVNARKNFQPQADNHVEIEFHVVCVVEDMKLPTSVIFVTATQDRYALKKSKESASVGVSAIGSVSLPWGSSDDSLVKVASETIPAGKFYERFFQLLEKYLPAEAEAPAAASAAK